MSGIGGVNNYAAARTNETSKEKTETPSTQQASGMTMDDFYKLLATQMQYQDADNPMDTSEMMSQMVQTQMIEAINNMSQINTITYAASMVGKEVTMAEIDSSGRFTEETTKGIVTGAILGSDPRLYIGDKQYRLFQMMSMGDVKIEKPGDGGNTGDGGGDNTGDGGGDGGK